MKAFVTGGTGFIGSHLVDELINREGANEIRCLVRSNEKWLSGKPYKPVRGDLFDTDQLRAGLEGVDVLFHIAAIVKAPEKSHFERANVQASEQLVRLAAEAGVTNLVLLSSLAAAGPSQGQPLTESDPMKPVSMYGKSKKEMEERIMAIASDSMSIKIIRPPVVYGPREDQIFTWFQMANRRLCPMVGNGDHPRLSIVYVSDLIDAILKASDYTTPGVHTFFAGGPEIASWNRIRHLTSKILEKRTLPLYIQPGLVKRVASIVESTGAIFGAYPVLNREKAAEMIHEWTCNHEKATTILGYEPAVSLEEGLRKTLDWYKTNNWL
jgi:dihydroflavonol-4-reductase